MAAGQTLAPRLRRQGGIPYEVNARKETKILTRFQRWNRVQGIPRVEHWKWSFYTKVLHITLFKIYPLARPFQPPTRLVHFVATHLAPQRPASTRLVLPFLSPILACSSVLLYRRLSPLLSPTSCPQTSLLQPPAANLLSSLPFETSCLFIPLSLLNMICLLGIPPCPSREERFAN